MKTHVGAIKKNVYKIISYLHQTNLIYFYIILLGHVCVCKNKKQSRFNFNIFISTFLDLLE